MILTQIWWCSDWIFDFTNKIQSFWPLHHKRYADFIDTGINCVMLLIQRLKDYR